MTISIDCRFCGEKLIIDEKHIVNGRYFFGCAKCDGWHIWPVEKRTIEKVTA